MIILLLNGLPLNAIIFYKIKESLVSTVFKAHRFKLEIIPLFQIHIFDIAFTHAKQVFMNKGTLFTDKGTISHTGKGALIV